jgi:hypothetical protein
MSTAVYVVIGVVVVLAIIAVLVAAGRRRSGQLRSNFGPEYDRTLQTTGDRRLAEKELAGRVDRRKQLDIVPLAEGARQQYLAQWQQVQADFVDAPVQSVQQADALVARVMTDRGYPMAEFDQRAADISVDHPSEVENYRTAHALCLNSGQERASTEDLRVAMTHYRALFDRLLGAGDTRPDTTDTRRAQPAATSELPPDPVSSAAAPPSGPPSTTGDMQAAPTDR